MNPSIDRVVKNSLCCACGLCEDSCPQKAIFFAEKNGVPIPQVDKSICKNKKGCDLCYRACAGAGIEFEKYSASYKGSKWDKFIGNYLACYVGYSLDYDIRFTSTSGGMVSAFCIYLLEKKIINGVVCSRFSKNNPLRTETFIATTKDEILSAKGSKYCPVSFNGIFEQIKNFSGKLVVVGLPHHIQAFKKHLSVFPKQKEKFIGFLGLYCSSTRNYNAIKSILKRKNIKGECVKNFSFRTDGYLGNMVIETFDGKKEEEFYYYYYRLHSFFKPKRCLFCIDHYAKLSDVSFGDIYLPEYEDKIGINGLVVRNPQFNEYLQSAARDGYIFLEEITAEDINKSQGQMQKRQSIIVPFHLWFEKLIGNKIPIYDTPKINLTFWQKIAGLKTWLSFKLQRIIGRWI